LIATLTLTQSFPGKKEKRKQCPLRTCVRFRPGRQRSLSLPLPPSGLRPQRQENSANIDEQGLRAKNQKKKKTNNLDCFSFCYYVLLADKNPRSVAPSIAEFCASKTGCSSLVPVSVTLKIGLVSREVTAATST
jgi:hypothetical protein